ncbi:MAG: hypothetical protein HZB29_03180 [Nitrospinae bacterium]|nr:hypothetical protein [Nitrospinota bacterium]
MTVNWKKLLILGLLMLAPLMLARCGTAADSNSASSTVGPKGPTSPSKYYFDLTAASLVVTTSGTAYYEVRVWDSNGNAAGNVNVTFSGDFETSGNTLTTGITGIDGITGMGISVKGSAGTVMYLTASVENLSLTIPVQVVSTK